MVFRLESADPFGAIVDVVKWFVPMKGGLDNQEIPIRLALLLPVRRESSITRFCLSKTCLSYKRERWTGIRCTHRPGSAHCQI